MSENKPRDVESRNRIIDYDGRNMLVSASAGTGKTTIMISRILSLIKKGLDVENLVVVTFTNLAAAEMKRRLSEKLSEESGSRIVRQLEKLDNAAICTLHSFCGDLLRNYFYVADVDPSFAILDAKGASALQSEVLDDLTGEYFAADDEGFRRLYRIFAERRNEENFRKVITKLYEFSRCLPDFGEWYGRVRQHLVNYSDDNPMVRELVRYAAERAEPVAEACREAAEQLEVCGMSDCAHDCRRFADEISRNGSAEQYLNSLMKADLKLPAKNTLVVRKCANPELAVETLDKLRVVLGERRKSNKFGFLEGRSLSEAWRDNDASLQLTDKLAEVITRFDQKYFEAKKQRGAVDFNDLEHLALKVLRDPDASKDVHKRYEAVFVDEYQDTNPVQEEIISLLARGAKLFMVGDVKQSIYHFRGCDPTIFADKYSFYKQSGEGAVEELSVNFRTDNDILHFVNDVFSLLMTQRFGNVDYLNTSCIESEVNKNFSPSVKITLVQAPTKEKQTPHGLYQIKQAEESVDVTQGEIIAEEIKRCVGKKYRVNGEVKTIGYGDVAVLVRGLKGTKRSEIYRALVRHNIPVTGGANVNSLSSKEVRDVVNLLRVLDNPYNDVYVAGACLSPFGGFTHDEMAEIKLRTAAQKLPFYTRMQKCVAGKNDELAKKTEKFLDFCDEMRFLSYSATVDEVILAVMRRTNYHLYVQSYPNGAARIRNLYAFLDGLKGMPYAQSVERFLTFVDESEGTEEAGAIADTDAVRIMTMHASKGLEFPVVFLAQLESEFKIDSAPQKSSSELGLAMKAYDFEKMLKKTTPAYVACELINNRRQQEEEMRLLYVAMTRAKYMLHMVAAAGKDLRGKKGAEARSHADWLLYAVTQKYGLNAHFITVRDALSPDEVAQSRLLCSQTASEEQVLNDVNYRYPFREQTDMPMKLVSSALDRDYLDTDSPWESVALSDEKTLLGTAYHKVLQYADYGGDQAHVRGIIDFLVAQQKITSETAAQLDVQKIFDVLHNPDLAKLMSNGKVYREISFMLKAPYDEVAKQRAYTDEVMLQGVIDLLIVSQNRATVVDFKYTSHRSGIEQRYRAQMASYRLAVSRIQKIPEVLSYVFSIEDNELLPVE